MPNLTNNKKWIEPTNISPTLEHFSFNESNFNELLSALEVATTLNEAESAVNWIFERDIFLDNL